MTINQRIKILIVSNDINEKKIHEDIGMSSKMVKNYIDGDKVPNYIFLKWLFTRFNNLNPQWLFSEEGGMYLEEGKIPQNRNEKIKSLESEILELKNIIVKQLNRQDEKIEEMGKLVNQALGE